MSKITQVVGTVLEKFCTRQVNPIPAEVTPPPAQEPPKAQEDPRLKYTLQLQKLRNFASDQGELDAYVDASIRELSWIAVSRSQSTVILSDFLSKLSWYVLEQTRYLDAQRELEKVKQDSQPIH